MLAANHEILIFKKTVRMAAIDKAKIIEAIQQTEDDRILFAINRLLQIEEDIPDCHKRELDQRNERIDSGSEVIYDWDEIKDEIRKSD